MNKQQFLEKLETHVRLSGGWSVVYNARWAEHSQPVAVDDDDPISEEPHMWQLMVAIEFRAKRNSHPVERHVDEWFYKAPEHPDGESWEACEADPDMGLYGMGPWTKSGEVRDA